jgi:hypothetical protein
MNLKDPSPGRVFEGDYPESYGPGLAALQATVARQVGRLKEPGHGTDARLIGILMGRRCGDLTRTQIETDLRTDRSTSLLGRGELTMSAADYRNAAAGPYVRDFTEARTGADVLLRRPQACRAEVVRIIRDLTGKQITASANYLTTMAAIGKGIGGPEPAPRLPDFGQYRIPDAAVGGRRVKVAVIDTGILQAARGDHWLDSVPRTADNIDLLDVLPAGPDNLLDYMAGHGTFVAGVIQRVAPSADITMYRAADTDGFASDYDIAAAIRQAHADGAEVINLSLGSRTVDDQPPPLMAQAVHDVQSGSGHRSVIVAAAGNYGDYSTVYPAALQGVIAVAGLTDAMEPAEWSSRGAYVRFSTVGEGIRSVYVEGVESPVFDPEPDSYGPNAAAVWSGTSFAAPQITGAIARIVAECDESIEDAIADLDNLGFSLEADGYGKAMRILEGIG